MNPEGTRVIGGPLVTSEECSLDTYDTYEITKITMITKIHTRVSYR